MNSSEVELLDIDCPIDFTALEKNIYLRHKASIQLFLIINNITTHNAMT